jgi:uncharacterized membrane protein (DUF485 family)
VTISHSEKTWLIQGLCAAFIATLAVELNLGVAETYLTVLGVFVFIWVLSRVILWRVKAGLIEQTGEALDASLKDMAKASSATPQPS